MPKPNLGDLYFNLSPNMKNVILVNDKKEKIVKNSHE